MILRHDYPVKAFRRTDPEIDAGSTSVDSDFENH
jgi:hypothetical protein